MNKTTIKKVLILSLFLTITSCSNNQKSNFKYDYLIDKPSVDLKEEVEEDEFNKTYQEFKYNFDNIYLINFIENETYDGLSSKTSLTIGVENLENNYPYYRKENNDGSYYSLFYNPSSSAFIEDDNGKKNNLDNFTQDINISPYLDLYCFKINSANLGISNASANPSTRITPLENSNTDLVVSNHLFKNFSAFSSI